MEEKIRSIRDKWYNDCLVLNIPVSPSDVQDIIEELLDTKGELRPLTHLEYPSMPFDIGDTVYLMEKIGFAGGRPLYTVTKNICYGYFNFGNGWKIRLRSNRSKFKFAEFDRPVTDCGYMIFGNKKEAEFRVKDMCGIFVKSLKEARQLCGKGE